MSLHGIASRLDPDFDRKVRDIWARLEAGCGLAGILKTPIPHFSWVVGEGFDFPGLEPVLTDLARSLPLTRVRTSGLGVFTGETDIVLYIALVKDRALAAVHREVWDTAIPFIERPSAYYAPDAWVPHITLAHGDVDPEGLACAARLLAREDLHWTIPVTEYSLVFQEDDRAAEHARFAFSRPL
jgi:hypothetical protein